MSCHDSVGLVFKCLSKGAIDFLVKPIRKNELKNLWQHVWRRCQSSSGSGSESGTQTQKSVKSNSSQKADNSRSDDGEKNGSNGLNAGDGSDDGSGGQSSWTKRAVEIDSSQSMSPIDQVADCPDSTCAQVIRPNAENFSKKGVKIAAARETHEQSQPDTVAKGKDLEKIILNNMESKSENPMKIPLTPTTGAKLKSLSNVDCNMSIKPVDKHKGCRGSVQDDRCVLRRSEQSAFSRYNASSNIFKAPNGVMGSSSIIGNSVEVAKRESVSDIQAHSTVIYQSSNEVSNNIDMGSTTNKLRARPSIMKNKSETTSTLNGSSTAVNAVGTYAKSDFGQARNSGSGDSGSGTRIDENKSSQREAALNKFRQKKKERSFKKKVGNSMLTTVVTFSYMI
ncbi:hypothetical protein DH2020_040095 [Rehmannia glutinosa]|uniref:Response regulatory domain-containing protein n=1 Tax=Rehmannia glutinosa TaxID=99300 RepID=A0ABR0UVG4_REHGL